MSACDKLAERIYTSPSRIVVAPQFTDAQYDSLTEQGHFGNRFTMRGTTALECGIVTTALNQGARQLELTTAAGAAPAQGATDASSAPRTDRSVVPWVSGSR